MGTVKGFCSATMVLLRKDVSNWVDEEPPNRKAMTQGAMSTTAIGLIAGLAIAVLLVVARDVEVISDLWGWKTLFAIALAGLFTTSAVGRATTHFAKAVAYDIGQSLYDLVIVVSGSALVGILSREVYEPNVYTWRWLGVLLLFLTVRNVHLSVYQDVKGLKLGVMLGVAVLFIVIGIAFVDPTSKTVMGVVGAIGILLVIVQFSHETLRLFLQKEQKTERPTAAELLDAVIKQVEAFIEAGVLSKDQGHPVIDAARRAIEIKNQ